MGAGWLLSHQAFWKGSVNCGALSPTGSWVRHGLTLTALSTAIVTTVALAGIARSRAAPRPWLVRTFWIASLALWTTLAVMTFELVSGNMCRRGFW